MHPLAMVTVALDQELGLVQQVAWLFVLAVPIATVAWTVTHEEVFREPREYCQRRSTECRTTLARKFYYLFTCEYCFSHYITAIVLVLTRYKLLIDDWRGYVLAFFALVWIANIYMSAFGRLRVDIRHEQAQADLVESEKREILDAEDGPPADDEPALRERRA